MAIIFGEINEVVIVCHITLSYYLLQTAGLLLLIAGYETLNIQKPLSERNTNLWGGSQSAILLRKESRWSSEGNMVPMEGNDTATTFPCRD